MLSVPLFADSTLVLRISGLNSIESDIDVKRLLFLGHLITQPKMSVAVRTLFQSMVLRLYIPYLHRVEKIVKAKSQ